MLGSALIGPRMRYGEGNLNSGDHKPMTQLAGVFRSHFPGVLSESLYGELATSFFKLPISVFIASSKFLRAVASRDATFAI
jgi:hypothetical protein